MSHVAKQLYRKIDTLFPYLQKVEPFTKLDFSDKSCGDIHLVMLEPERGAMNFILTRYDNGKGNLIANPSFEIIADVRTKTANVVTYKDPHYFHSAELEAKDIGTISLCQANRFLYDFLNDLNGWKRSHDNDNRISATMNYSADRAGKIAVTP